MAQAKNALIQIESGRTVNDYAAMTDSGDNQIFTISGGLIWSGRDSYEPIVRPNGMVTGRNVLTIHTDNDKVTIAAFTAYSKSNLQTVTATTQAITRPGTAGLSQIHSITMASDGTIAVVEGTLGSDTTFSSTRAAAGGPPLIPIEDVEIGQVRTTTSTAAALSADDLFQVVGTHTERYDFPIWTESNLGDGIGAAVSAQTNAHIKFDSALPDIHTGTLPKAVYIKYYAPIFAAVSRSVDFTPAEKSHSVSSQQLYGNVIGSTSESLGAGGFTALLDTGIVETLVTEKNQILTCKFFPNRNNDPFILTQGTIGLGRTFPAEDHIQTSVSISAEEESAEFSS